MSALSFTKVTSGDADIIIDFVRGRHTALDPNDFDGPGNVLAHAFFPNRFSSLAGDAHFDEDEMFTENTNRGLCDAPMLFFSRKRKKILGRCVYSCYYCFSFPGAHLAIC